MESNFKYCFGHVEYDLASRTHLMGILNVTPDSFSDGGSFFRVDQAVDHGMKMAEDGADFIDVGGESTRPGSESVPVDEEIKRVLPVIEALAKKVRIPISIDTYKSAVAEAAIEAGAVLVNDITAMTFDEKMVFMIAKHGASVVLMHIKGVPKTMQQNPLYEDVTKEVEEFLQKRLVAARTAGIRQIILDPGIGFGKKFEHNIQLLQNLRSFHKLGCPILVGPSRKSFLGTILNLPPAERVEGTAAAVAASIMNGAHIVRVHDVKEMKRVAMVIDTLKFKPTATVQ